MKKVVLTSVLAAGIVAVLVSTAFAHGDRGGGGKARLTGYQETPFSLSTSGHGSFRVSVRSDELRYVLRYEDLEADATAAHIHLGQKATTGGVIAFLCGGGGKPACPAREGRVEGTIRASDVIGPATQGIAAMEFSEVVRALRHGAVYANVHTTKYTGGEIRGQVGHRGHHHGDHKRR